MKRPKIFSIGGATFDIFVKPTQQGVMEFTTQTSRDKYLCLRYGGKVQAQDVLETFGGGATNTAVAFARMGFDAAFIGMVGDEYGDKVLKNLKSEGVSTRYAKQTDRDKTSFSVIINTFDGDRTVLGYAGANRFFKASDLPLDALAKADWIFLNHLTETSGSVPNALLKLLRRNPGIKLAWNPGHECLTQGAKKWKDMLKRTEILILNKEEAALFSGVPYKLAGIKKDDPKYHIHIPRSFLPPYADDVSDIMLEFFKYGVKNAVITDARHGAQASDGKRLYFCPVVTHKRVDTLGAGDAFGSGFVSAIIMGKSLKTALIYGTLNATSVVAQYGAQPGLLTYKQIEHQFKNVEISPTSTKLLLTNK
jgi:sugar/nucleoside kinase (ribokinase family)